MKKRILSILCALCLLVGLLPVTAVTAAAAPKTTTYSYAYDVFRSPAFPASKGAEIEAKYFSKPLKHGARANSDTYDSPEGTWTLTEMGPYSEKNTFSPAPTTYLDSIVSTIANRYGLETEGKNALMIHKLTDASNNLVGYGVVVAADETNGYVLFIADILYSDGAGYMLSNSALSGSVKLNTEKMAQSASYSIGLSTASVSFADAQTGYTAPAAQTITVTNTGSAATGALSVTLSGTNASSFTLNKTSLDSVAKDGTASFTVVPKAGLEAGTYTATITVKGTNVLPETCAVSFKVTVPVSKTYSYAYDAQRSPAFPASKGDEISLTNLGRPLKYGSVSTSSTKYTSSSGSWTLTEVGAYGQKDSFSPAPTTFLTSVVNGVKNAYGLDDSGRDALMIHKLTDEDNVLVGYGVVVAVDEANELALFVGDLWASSGAGYLLSNSAQSGAVNLNTDQMVQSSYSVSLSPASVNFSTAETGYAAPAARTITVTNTGNAATGALSVTLSGTNASSFTLNKTSLDSIAKDGTASFTVVPKAGLEAGTHTATITVKGTNVLPETVNVSFIVNAPTTYSVTFVGGTGAVGTAPTQANTAKDGTFSLPENPFTKAEHTFAGWNDGTRTYEAGAEYTMPGHAVTFTAQWTPTTYSVTFVGGTGAVGTAPTQANTAKDGTFSLPENPFTKAEHTFAGWNDGARTYEAGAEYTMPGHAVTFTAQWTPRNYTVTLDPQGGTIAEGKNVTGYIYGVGATLPTVDDMSRTGYTFAGWYVSAAPAADDPAVASIGTTDSQDKVFYAKWTPNQYTVTFNANGGEGSMDAQTFTYGVTQTLSPNAFTRNGYSFAGWASSANGDLLYKNKESISLTANTVLFAKWTADPTPGHTCTTRCEFCGKCTDQKCRSAACTEKCDLDRNVFTDVEENTWYTDAVKYVYHRGMMEGFGDGLFDIDAATTRAMIVTILWRLEGAPVVDYRMAFEDVPAKTWYTEAVRWAASEKIVEGWNGKFDPMGKITREQFAVILWRYAKYKGYDVSVGEDTNILNYEDAASISEYAIPAMQWACGSGLMQGSGAYLTPKANATRTQAAALLQRFCEKIVQ